MAAKVLLDVVQLLLADTDGDEVNSISDTQEATQYASAIASIYNDISIEYDLQAVKQLFKLDASTDSALPTHMRIPDGFHSVEWINYDKRQQIADPTLFQKVNYLAPAEFMNVVNGRNSADVNTLTVVDPVSTVTLRIFSNLAPTWYTMFDDRTVVFDAYNIVVDDTLQQSKSQAYGQRTKELVIADQSLIDLPEHLYTLLVNEARAFVFDVYKDGATQRVERRASRSRIRSQRIGHSLRVNQEQFRRPDYGRRRPC